MQKEQAWYKEVNYTLTSDLVRHLRYSHRQLVQYLFRVADLGCHFSLEDRKYMMCSSRRQYDPVRSCLVEWHRGKKLNSPNNSHKNKNKTKQHRHLTNPIQIVDSKCYLVNAGWGLKRYFNHAG